MIITLVSTLIKLTLTGSVMALAVLLLRFIFKSKLPRTFIVFLWMLSFAAFVIPVSLPAPAFISGIYSENISPAVNTVSQFKAVSKKTAQKVKITLPAKPHNTKTAPIANSKYVTAVDPYNIIAAAYGVVSITLMILFLLLYAMTLKRFNRVLPVEDSAVLKGLRKKVRVRRAVSLCLSDKTSVPVTVGTIRSKIVLPSDFDLENKELTEHIYVHELIHVKRHDNAVSLIALFIACLHWFNPIVWLMYSMLCRDMELACDSTAVKIFGYSQRSEYAQSLLIMAGRKRKIQPMFVAAFGKYDIKERVKNVMNTRKISAKILGVCMMALLVVGTSFTAMSFTKAADVSAAAISQKNIMTAKNKKLFKGYVFEYYSDTLAFDKKGNPLKVSDYTGKITSGNLGAGMMRCAINKNQSGISLKKYTNEGTATEQWGYVFPQKIGDTILKSCFDIKTIDHSKIPFYNAKSKKYVVSGGDFPNDTSNVPVIKSIKQAGNTVVVTVSFYGLKASDGSANYKNKLQSMKFTFKVCNGKYLFSKIQTI